MSKLTEILRQNRLKTEETRNLMGYCGNLPQNKYLLGKYPNPKYKLKG